MKAPPVWHQFGVVFMAAFVPRVLVAFFFPASGGDSATYATVAENIVLNACVSMSDPASGACVPHWGGNHLPGFPAVTGALWWIFPTSWMAVTITQSFVAATVTTYLFQALTRLLDSQRVALFAALTVALSPLTLPWARYSLPDALAVCAGVWVAAELMHSLAESRLRLLTMSIALTAALFLRLDSVFLGIPVAVVGFYLHSPAQAIRRGLTICLIVSLPLGLWVVRSAFAGLGWTPQANFLMDGSPTPTGYLDWARTWATSQYQAPNWWFPVRAGRYSEIKIDPGIYLGEEEQRQVEHLLSTLAKFERQAFPAHVDQEFAALATERRMAAPIPYWLLLPLERIRNIWFNPLNSAGWPVAVGWSGGIASPKDLMSFVAANPSSVAVKGSTAIYRAMLPVVVVFLCVWSLRHGRDVLSVIAWAALLYAIVRTVFLGWFFLIESRYLLGSIPFLELAVAIGLAEYAKFRQSINRP